MLRAGSSTAFLVGVFDWQSYGLTGWSWLSKRTFRLVLLSHCSPCSVDLGLTMAVDLDGAAIANLLPFWSEVEPTAEVLVDASASALS